MPSRSNNVILGGFILLFILITGCGSMKDDLLPSGTNKAPTGLQIAPDFTVSDTFGNLVTLSSVFQTHQGVVLYFTMWCPTCDSHMTYIRDVLIPAYPNVVFYAVDYVSGSVSQALQAEIDNGYAGSGFIVLADTAQTVLNLYHATMATTVVIDKNGFIEMNELFKADRLQSVLGTLP